MSIALPSKMKWFLFALAALSPCHLVWAESPTDCVAQETKNFLARELDEKTKIQDFLASSQPRTDYKVTVRDGSIVFGENADPVASTHTQARKISFSGTLRQEGAGWTASVTHDSKSEDPNYLRSVQSLFEQAGLPEVRVKDGQHVELDRHTKMVLRDLADQLSSWVSENHRQPSAASTDPKETTALMIWKSLAAYSVEAQILGSETRQILGTSSPDTSGLSAYNPHAKRSIFVGEEGGISFFSEKMNRQLSFHTKYLHNEEERAPYRLTVKEGKIYGADGKPFDTSDSVLDGLTKEKGRAILVMGLDGKLYSLKDQTFGSISHSTLLAGKPVAFAGELLVEDGVIKAISNKSGHYFPPTEVVAQLLTQLAKEGIDVSSIRLDPFDRN
jgi:hypothetical protein